MEPFTVTKENLTRVIPSVVAENSDYKLRIMYDGDYAADSKSKSVNPKKLVVGAKPKRPGLLAVEYQAFNEKAFVVLPSNEVCTEDIKDAVSALLAAEEAATLIRDVVKKYL